MQAIKCVVLGDGAVGKLSKIKWFLCSSILVYFPDWRYQFKQITSICMNPSNLQIQVLQIVITFVSRFFEKPFSEIQCQV